MRMIVELLRPLSHLRNGTVQRRTFAQTTTLAKLVTHSFPATFYRGGTSNGLVIKADNLPSDPSKWRPILSSAMGSPDEYGRQLDGIGSGISSTSKVMVVAPSTRKDADVDYTFVQVGIKDGSMDLAGNCGNMTSAIGPFAVDEGLVKAVLDDTGEEATIRLFNTNTSKIIHSTFSVSKHGKFVPHGDYSIDGVPGYASRITLSFLDPGGAKTGMVLPTGRPVDTITLADGKTIQATLTDIANPGVFVLAADIGVRGDVTPDELGADMRTMALLEEIRQEGAKLMGMDPAVQSVPKIVLLSAPSSPSSSTDVDSTRPGSNIICRAISMQQAHKAVPLTLALNLGAACRIPGTLPAQIAVRLENEGTVFIEHASGRLAVGSLMADDGGVKSALLHRTARPLMKGEVFYSVEESNSAAI